MLENVYKLLHGLILNLFPEKDTEDKITAEEKRRQELLNHTE